MWRGVYIVLKCWKQQGRRTFTKTRTKNAVLQVSTNRNSFDASLLWQVPCGGACRLCLVTTQLFIIITAKNNTSKPLARRGPTPAEAKMAANPDWWGQGMITPDNTKHGLSEAAYCSSAMRQAKLFRLIIALPTSCKTLFFEGKTCCFVPGNLLHIQTKSLHNGFGIFFKKKR